MAWSISSSSDITTYSMETRISKIRRKEKKSKDIRIHNFNQKRKELFAETAKLQELEIYDLPGLDIKKFTHKRIRLSFQPSLVYKHISKKDVFHFCLRYLERYKKWIIKHEPIPAKPIFQKVTLGKIFIEDNLDELQIVILNIYKILKRWSEREIEYRQLKYEKYKSGLLDYTEIDSVDEELYFSEGEKQALYEKQNQVLQRMIPPEKTRRSPRRRKTRLKYII